MFKRFMKWARSRSIQHQSLLERLEDRQLFSSIAVTGIGGDGYFNVDEAWGERYVIVNVELTGGDTEVPFSWQVQGGATNPVNGDDFEGGVMPSGSDTFDGNSNVDIRLVIRSDHDAEPTESFRVKITAGAGVTVYDQSQDFTITDDDYKLTLSTPNGSTGTLLDPDGIDVVAKLTDWDNHPIIGQYVGLTTPAGVNWTPVGDTVTNNAGEVALKLISNEEVDNGQFMAEVWDKTGEKWTNFQFKKPVIQWDKGSTDTLVKGGSELVTGKLFKWNGTTPFPNIWMNEWSEGDDLDGSATDGVQSDANGAFAVRLGARAYGQIGTEHLSIPYYKAGNLQEVDSAVTFTGISPTITTAPPNGGTVRMETSGTKAVAVEVKNGTSGRTVAGYAFSLDNSNSAFFTMVADLGLTTNDDGLMGFHFVAGQNASDNPEGALLMDADNTIRASWLVVVN